MSDVSKKYILNLMKSEMSSHFAEFFSELQVELHSQLKDGIEYKFILIDSEDIELPSTCGVIFVGSPSDRVKFLKNNGKAIIGENILDNEIEKIILKRLLGENSSLSLEKAFDNEISSNGSFKVTDHFHSGYYSDLIAAKAVNKEFDYLNIRNGFFNLMNFISVTVDSKSGEFPVEVDFGVSEDKFIIQAHYNVEDFGAEYLWNALSNDENNYLSLLLNYIETLDSYILEKTGRLVLTLIFSKTESKSSNIFIHNIDSFKLVNLNELVGKSKEETIDHFGEVSLASEKTSSISKVMNILEDDQMSDGHLVKVTRITKFILKSKLDLTSLSIDNFSEYVKDYPNLETINLLTVNDKKLIIDSVANSDTLKTLSDSLEEVEKVAGVDEFLDNLIQKVEGLSLEEANEIVTVGGEVSEDDAITRVGGWLEQEDNHKEVIKGEREDLAEETQLIKGSKEDLTPENILIKGSPEEEDTSKVVIKGESEKLESGSMEVVSLDSSETNSQWSTTKSDIISEIRKRAEKLKEERGSLSDLSNEVTSIVGDKLNIEESESSALSKGLFENASEKFVTNKPIGKGNGGEHVKARLENEKLQQQIIRKDSQLIRMKRLVDNMKRELTAQKEASLPIEEKEESKLQEVVDNSEKLENSNLQDEVKRLESQLQMAQQRVETLSQKSDQDKENASSKFQNETKILKEKLAKGQEIITKFKEDNSSLSREVFDLKRLKEEFENKANLLASNDHAEELKTKEADLAEANKMAKQNEDRYRAASLRIKQLEQKNKFLNAQVTEASKKAKKGAGSAAGGKPDAKSSHKIKQLERLNEKLKGSSKKFETELAAKKKEAHKMKLEANTLKLKVDELERKVSKLDKKAA